MANTGKTHFCKIKTMLASVEIVKVNRDKFSLNNGAQGCVNMVYDYTIQYNYTMKY